MRGFVRRCLLSCSCKFKELLRPMAKLLFIFTLKVITRDIKEYFSVGLLNLSREKEVTQLN